ncbi:MAG: DUF5361 domain-containing protein [Actinobacteria bacterium]|nr:DUF5361 domain-containing protein [Actinomycetota bacterium]
MAEGFEYHGGGILGILEILEDSKKYRALERDLLEHGLRLRQVGSRDFTWRDLFAFVSESAQDSAFFRASFPTEWMWDHKSLLLAEVADRLAILAWQNTEDGHKGKRPPAPMDRPGIEQPNHKVKGEAIPLDEFDQRMTELRSRLVKKQRVKKISNKRKG